jgi:hypothetical protein
VIPGLSAGFGPHRVRTSTETVGNHDLNGRSCGLVFVGPDVPVHVQSRARGCVVHLTVHNPIGVPTEESVRRESQLIGAGLAI